MTVTTTEIGDRDPVRNSNFSKWTSGYISSPEIIKGDKPLFDRARVGKAASRPTGLGFWARSVSAPTRWAGKVHCKGDRRGTYWRKRENVENNAARMAGATAQSIDNGKAPRTFGSATTFSLKGAIYRNSPRTTRSKPSSDNRWYAALICDDRQRPRDQWTYAASPIAIGDVISNEAKWRSKSVKVAPKKKIRVLDKHEEASLVRRAKAGDRAALNQLVIAFQPLINKIAEGYADNADHREELVAVVNAANVIEKSALQFDPTRGYRLATFLRQPIKWAVNVTFRSRDALNKTSKPRPHDDSELTTQERENFLLDTADDGADCSEFEGAKANRKLREAFGGLDERERRIAVAHFGLNGEPARTLKQISAERCRQILVVAGKKIGLPELGMRL